MKKRVLLSSLLFVVALCLVVSAMAKPVSAAEVASGTCGDTVSWVLDDTGTLTISGEGAMADYAAGSDAPWYAQRTSITKIVVEDTVTSIGDRAFYNCTALTEVSIGEGVLTIGTYAFRGCTALQSVTIPANVTELKDSAFRACTALTEITFDGNAPAIGNYVFNDGAASLTVHYYEGSTGFNVEPWTSYTRKAHHVGEWVVDVEATCTTDGSRHIDCSYCGTTITETYPNSHAYVDEICSLCGKIFGLSYSSSGDKVKITAYTGSRTSLKIPTTIEGKPVTNIGNSAFEDCDSLTSVTIPDSVTSIGELAFSGCTNLTSITIPDSVTIIGEYAFYGCSGLEDVYITDPGAWCKITFCDFRDRYDYHANPMYYADTLHILDEYGNEVDEVVLDDTVTVIPSFAFSDCSGLTSITIPDSVTSIGKYAFAGCTGLTSISILDGVTSIGDYAFRGCSSLTSITIPDGVTSISDYSFSGCSGLTSIIIPDSVTSIGDFAFSDCSGLTSVAIPDSVTRIGQRSFSRCSGLTDIAIPDSVTSIDWGAFCGCSGLTSVMIGNGVTSIAGATFSGCSDLTSVTIPDSVTRIGEDFAHEGYGAFDGCSSLTGITIPDSVTYIGQRSFSGCTGLTNVIYCGTKDQKKSITVESYNTNLTTATWHYEVEKVTLSDQTSYYCSGCDRYYYENGTRVSLADLELLLPPNVRNCTKNGTVSLEGISLKGIYANGKEILLGAEDVENIAADLTSIGKKTATVQILGAYADFVVYVHEYDYDKVYVDSSLYPESEHYYANDIYETKTFTYPGAKSLIVTFSSRTSVENYYDYIYIYDGYGAQIGKYTGTSAANLTLTIPGDSFRIILHSNWYGREYGYAFSSIVANMDGWFHPPMIDPATVTCTQAGLSEGSHCEICDLVLVEQVQTEALGHDWKSAFAWSEDYSECVITLTCGRDNCDAVETHDCEITTETFTASNCKEQSYVIYKATYETHSAEEKVMGDFGPHKWLDATCTADETCELCGQTRENTQKQHFDSETDADHICDTCDEVLSSCVDENKDHKCDLCGESVGKHEAEEGKHTCGYCGGTVSQCADENKDHKCDTCGKEMTECVDENTDYECDICGKDLPMTSGTCGDNATWVLDNEGTLTISGTGRINYSWNSIRDSIKKVVIENGITSIGDEAFSGCTELTSIEIPDNVTSIGNSAFSGCSGLTDIAIPDNGIFVGICAFSGCTSLTRITIPGSINLGKGNSTSVFMDCTGLTSVTIEKGCTVIPLGMFSGCTELTSIIIPDSIRRTDYSFSDNSKLQDVYFGGTSAAWHEICEGTVEMPDETFVHYGCTEPVGHWTSQNIGGIPAEVCPCGYMKTIGDALITRLAGSDRIKTSFLVADQLKIRMCVEKFDSVIVASGKTFADALPGSYLSAVKNAPILLTLAKDKYVNQTADYIRANLASGGTVYILGGESAVPASMEKALSGYNVQRVAGSDRFGTNLAILNTAGIKDGDEILVCTAKDYADSLSASAAGKPILLVYKKLTDAQKAFLDSRKGKNSFCLVGGTAAVPEAFEKELKTYGAVTRLAGKDRLETSVLVAKKYFPNAKTAVVAYGWDFPDGLCGGSLAYATRSPLILTHSKEKLYKFTADYTAKAGLKAGYVLGGSGLVSDTATKAIFGMGSGNINVLQ